MSIRSKHRHARFDVVVVGGGMNGLCAAIASARHGAKTALVQDRPVLGGNASSEIRMHICGAGVDMTKPNLEETGILYELMLENKRVNDSYNYSIWSTVLWSAASQQKNLTLFLNCAMYDVSLQGKEIVSIDCYQSTTECHWHIEGSIFDDATGNGTLGYMAGVPYRTGSEAKRVYGEPHAPEKADNNRMGNTLLFKAVDTGHPVKFTAPSWAWHFTEEDLKYRNHPNLARGQEALTLLDTGSADGKQYTEAPCLDYGYWWIELSGKGRDIISEYEPIRDDLIKAVYGVWDHIKNVGDHGAANYELAWVGMLPGVRESRRLMGEYVLNENDVLSGRRFPDAVAYGGWPVDAHCAHGLLDRGKVPSLVHSFPGCYTIPYRCYVPKKVDNLFISGRSLSASKLGMASSRVMGTCSVGGQAVGTAASLCIKYGISPREVGRWRIDELQQQLLKDDCYIPGVRNHDPKDLALQARVSASSGERDAALVLDGVSRPEGEERNYWESGPLSEGAQTLSLCWDKRVAVRQVRLTWYTDLTRPVKITMSSRRQKLEQVGVPRELVKDYDLSFFDGERLVARKAVRGNSQRLNVVDLEKVVRISRLEVKVLSTNGAPVARLFEIRAY